MSLEQNESGRAGQADLLEIYSPDIHLPELFAAVANTRDSRLGIVDGKELVDCAPLRNPAEIRMDYLAAAAFSDFDAVAFWGANLTVPPQYEVKLVEIEKPPVAELREYIDQTWADLTYHAPEDHGTMIGTPYPHLKSGRRYSEGYYWDVFNGLEGLVLDAGEEPARWDFIVGVLNNFRNLIERFGFIPTATRSYYLSRSQPPKFASMVKLVGEYKPELVEEYLPWVVKEYQWWTKGDEQLKADSEVRAADHSVRMPDGSILARYWDTKDTPRPESQKEDIETAALLPKVDPRQIYRNLRIVAETGRDFNGEYLADVERLETVYADRIIPVDLNALLWEYEDFIAQAHHRAGRSNQARIFDEKASARAAAMNKYQWVGDNQTGYYCGFLFDPDFRQGEPTQYPSMAMAAAAARDLAPVERTKSVSQMLVTRFLKRGGYVGSLTRTGHQWDAPNGWAPDQVEADAALERTARLTGEESWNLYRRVARAKFVNVHARIYRRTGKIVEKCNVIDQDPLRVMDGEYPLQDGFLWTNGVLRKFMEKTVICPTMDTIQKVNKSRI
ncbi:MAG TPA: trehalase family glycosidase [Patescibacteria group bacterium]|nr:trehalase family glycosidase [Patescibacteria group bacterium]